MKLILLESKQLFRSKWLQIVTVLFSVIFTAILMIQHLALPDAGGYTRQTASLLNILLFLLPLFILTIGSMNIAGDIESGWLGLLRTYPLKLRTYLVTKYIALTFIFLVMLVIVLLIALAFGSLFGGLALPGYAVYVSLALVFMFSALSILLGSFAKSRLHALALSLGLWAFVTLIGSYIIMAIGTLISETMLKNIVMLSIHVNPLEWVRYLYFVLADETAVLGPAFHGMSKFYNSAPGKLFMGMISTAWVVGALVITNIVLKVRGKRT
ncbi:MAG: ABC transporter permease subunit [Caryophanon sp.]|nr:ABC transporter permease subunit [Caryophanon sp.]